MDRMFPVGATATADELAGDPHRLLARLRATEPVSWLPALDGWLVTRHDLAQDVMRDARTFTVDDPRFSTAQVIGVSMLSLDGVWHTRHRDPFARPLRPAPTRARFTAFVETEVDRLIKALGPRGGAELRGEFAGPLAVAVVAEALGLPDADSATIRSWYDAFVAAISDITAGRGAGTATEAYGELRAAVATTITGGASSLLAGLLADIAPGRTERGAAASGGRLTTEEVVANTAVLMFGGIDTTEGMIANAVLHLLGHPDQLALLRADPGLLPGAIEESLRFEPAAAVVDRYATRDVRLGHAMIRDGDLVRVSLTGANRDPDVFAEPDRFDIRRPNADRQLAFARGPHFCFGAHLARLETGIALRALLDRLPGLRLDRPAAAAGLVFRKPAELLVRWPADAFTV
jgi:cytochrome P450